MNSKKIFVIFALVSLILIGAYFILTKQSAPTATPTPLPSPSASPTPAIESSQSPLPELQESPLPSPEVINTIDEKSTEPLPAQSKVPKKAKGAKPLMEVVEDSSALGEETADGDDENVPKKTQALALPTLTPADTVDELMKDANHIVNGFEETDTDELVGVWAGTVKIPGKSPTQIAVNRIWDHMTDEYLPSSCVAFIKDSKLVSAYLRLKTLDFYEKPSNKRSKLIVKLKSNFLFELWAPVVGSNKTTGNLYQIKGNKLVLLGAVKLEKDLEATADTDCNYIE